MEKMKALVKSKPGRGLQLEEVPVPEPGINDLLIKIRKTGVCGTDLHIYQWDHWAQKHIHPPLVVGHEFAGTVVAVGRNVTGFSVGDVVSGEGHLVCGLCRNCLSGRRHLCSNTSSVGVDRTGAFAEYLCIPAVNGWHAHPALTLDQLSIFDPLGNATHTALSFNLVGEDILITGAGPIGCMATAIVRHAGARFVVVTDLNPFRRNLAKTMGADLVLDPSTEDLKEAQKKLGMTGGFDVGLEMSGSPKAFQSMLSNMFHGGRIALLGMMPPDTQIDWDQVITKGLMIKGIYGREMFATWYKMSAMLVSGLDISPVITHRFSYEDYEEAFAAGLSGDCGKIILEWA